MSACALCNATSASTLLISSALTLPWVLLLRRRLVASTASDICSAAFARSSSACFFSSSALRRLISSGTSRLCGSGSFSSAGSALLVRMDWFESKPLVLVVPGFPPLSHGRSECRILRPRPPPPKSLPRPRAAWKQAWSSRLLRSGKQPTPLRLPMLSRTDSKPLREPWLPSTNAERRLPTFAPERPRPYPPQQTSIPGARVGHAVAPVPERAGS